MSGTRRKRSSRGEPIVEDNAGSDDIAQAEDQQRRSHRLAGLAPSSPPRRASSSVSPARIRPRTRSRSATKTTREEEPPPQPVEEVPAPIAAPPPPSKTPKKKGAGRSKKIASAEEKPESESEEEPVVADSQPSQPAHRKGVAFSIPASQASESPPSSPALPEVEVRRPPLIPIVAPQATRPRHEQIINCLLGFNPLLAPFQAVRKSTEAYRLLNATVPNGNLKQISVMAHVCKSWRASILSHFPSFIQDTLQCDSSTLDFTTSSSKKASLSALSALQSEQYLADAIHTWVNDRIIGQNQRIRRLSIPAMWTTVAEVFHDLSSANQSLEVLAIVECGCLHPNSLPHAPHPHHILAPDAPRLFPPLLQIPRIERLLFIDLSQDASSTRGIDSIRLLLRRIVEADGLGRIGSLEIWRPLEVMTEKTHVTALAHCISDLKKYEKSIHPHQMEVEGQEQQQHQQHDLRIVCKQFEDIDSIDEMNFAENFQTRSCAMFMDEIVYGFGIHRGSEDICIGLKTVESIVKRPAAAAAVPPEQAAVKLPSVYEALSDQEVDEDLEKRIQEQLTLVETRKREERERIEAAERERKRIEEEQRLAAEEKRRKEVEAEEQERKRKAEEEQAEVERQRQREAEETAARKKLEQEEQEAAMQRAQEQAREMEMGGGFEYEPAAVSSQQQPAHVETVEVANGHAVSEEREQRTPIQIGTTVPLVSVADLEKERQPKPKIETLESIFGGRRDSDSSADSGESIDFFAPRRPAPPPPPPSSSQAVKKVNAPTADENLLPMAEPHLPAEDVYMFGSLSQRARVVPQPQQPQSQPQRAATPPPPHRPQKTPLAPLPIVSSAKKTPGRTMSPPAAGPLTPRGTPLATASQARPAAPQRAPPQPPPSQTAASTVHLKERPPASTATQSSPFQAAWASTAPKAAVTAPAPRNGSPYGKVTSLAPAAKPVSRPVTPTRDLSPPRTTTTKSPAKPRAITPARAASPVKQRTVTPGRSVTPSKRTKTPVKTAPTAAAPRKAIDVFDFDG